MWGGRRSPRTTLEPRRGQHQAPPLDINRAAASMEAAQARMAAADRRAERLEEVHAAQLAELRALRSVVGALGGTMGTVETHVGQLVAMAAGHLAPSSPQHFHGLSPDEVGPSGLRDWMPCPVPTCPIGKPGPLVPR